MNRIKKINPILVTGVERSGSTLVARILDMCGVFSGNCNSMYENKKIKGLHSYQVGLFPHTNTISIPVGWSDIIDLILKEQNWTGQHWMVKTSKIAQYWPIWHYSYPNAKWLIIRRRTSDVIESCMKTGYMNQMKNQYNLRHLNVDTEEQGWLWWIHQYEKKYVEMKQHDVLFEEVWPERMADGDFSQIKEIVENLGLKWNEQVPEVISPLLIKGRRNI